MGQFDLARSLTCPIISQDMVPRPPTSHQLKGPMKNEASLHVMWNAGLDPRTDKEH